MPRLTNTTDREKLTIARIEYGPKACDTKVFLSNGMQLDGLVVVAPESVTVDDICKVEITAILKGAENAETHEHD